MIIWIVEAMALTVIGAVAHLVTDKERDLGVILDDFTLAAVAGIAAFALFGEPTNATAIAYLTAGYSSGAFLDHILKPWWKEQS